MSIAKAGQLMLVDAGEYVSYQIIGLYRVLQDFDPTRVLAKYLKVHPEERENGRFNGYGYMMMLAREGWIEPVPHANLFLSTNYRASGISFDPQLGDSE